MVVGSFPVKAFIFKKNERVSGKEGVERTFGGKDNRCFKDIILDVLSWLISLPGGGGGGKKEYILKEKEDTWIDQFCFLFCLSFGRREAKTTESFLLTHFSYSFLLIFSSDP